MPSLVVRLAPSSPNTRISQLDKVPCIIIIIIIITVIIIITIHILGKEGKANLLDVYVNYYYNKHAD